MERLSCCALFRVFADYGTCGIIERMKEQSVRPHVFVLAIGMAGAGCAPSEPPIVAGHSSESFRSALINDFPLGSDGSRLENLLREQGFYLQTWPAARNSSRKEASHWDQRKRWGPRLCDRKVRVRWTVDQHGKILLIDGDHFCDWKT